LKIKARRHIKSPEDILKAIGREDIPSTDVTIQYNFEDPETGELKEFEIDFGEHVLEEVDLAKLKKVLDKLNYREIS